MSRSWIAPVALAALIAACLTPTASVADEAGFRAVVINTPGQNGHIPVGDFALRTLAGEGAPVDEPSYGPNMTDQLALYSEWQYRPGGFQEDSGTPDKELLGARIYRDPYGVPAIFAGDSAAAWRAVGYALSEDRMWQAHLLRMVARGRLSELVGEDGIDMDIAQRRDFYTDAEYQAVYDGLLPPEKSLLDSYAQGVNIYIAEMHADPSKMPAEIAALGLPIQPWTAIDSLALGTLMARSVASDGGQELENANLLKQLVAEYGQNDAEAIFNDLIWLNDPGAPTSVPAEEGIFSSYPGGLPMPAALSNSVEEVLQLPASFKSVARQLKMERKLKARLQKELGLPNPGSNVWAISPERSSNGSTFLFNGPQVGYTMPGLLAEFEIHITDGADAMDARGVSVVGVPVVGIGYTDHHMWGLTSGLSDTKDLYVETLVGDGKQYLHNGEELDMECRTERFIIKANDRMLLEQEPPSVEEHEFCRTIHGPVIEVDEEAGVAYSQKYATWDREFDTLKGLMKFPVANSLEEFTDAMSHVTWNENTTYADADGNIAYWHPGLYPERPINFDERLPYPGTGEAEWQGILDFEEMPHAINPAQGWLANWNSKPSVGWTSGDPHYGDRPWGQANRLHAITEVLESDMDINALPGPNGNGLILGREGIFAPDVNAGVFDHTIDYFRPFLAEAATDPDATEREKQALDLLVAWDGNREDEDGDGKYDSPAVSLFDAWVEPAAKSVFQPYMKIGGFSRGGHRFEPSPVINMFLRALLGDAATLPQSRDYLGGRTNNAVILSTLRKAFEDLEDKFGAGDIEAWLGDIYTEELEVQGLGPEGEIPFQDRGSWIQVIEYPAV